MLLVVLVGDEDNVMAVVIRDEVTDAILVVVGRAVVGVVVIAVVLVTTALSVTVGEGVVMILPLNSQSWGTRILDTTTSGVLTSNLTTNYSVRIDQWVESLIIYQNC